LKITRINSLNKQIDWKLKKMGNICNKRIVYDAHSNGSGFPIISDETKNIYKKIAEYRFIFADAKVVLNQVHNSSRFAW